MDTLQTLLIEKIAITKDQLLRRVTGEDLLIPENCTELIIPFKNTIEVQLLGMVRKVALKKGRCYLVRPRGRAMNVFGCSSYALIKCHAAYSKDMIKGLHEISHGIYEVQLTSSEIDGIMKCVEYRDQYGMNILLEDFFDLAYKKPNAVILNALEMIHETLGTIAIKDIYAELSISKSTLEQRFAKDIGLTPKEFCKIEKLKHFIRTYCANIEQSLTEITYQCGYYDQSHLIKDFNYFLNMSPRVFFRNFCKNLSYQKAGVSG